MDLIYSSSIYGHYHGFDKNGKDLGITIDIPQPPGFDSDCKYCGLSTEQLGAFSVPSYDPNQPVYWYFHPECYEKYMNIDAVEKLLEL